MEQPTGTEVLDSLLGAYTSEGIHMLYGNAASGKSTCCLLAAAQAAKAGRAVYMDTEHRFDPARLSQLAGPAALDSLLLFQPRSFAEQYQQVLQLPKLCASPKIRLVVVDTIGHHYRVEMRKDPGQVTQLFISQLRTLIWLCRDMGKVVLLASQVVADMQGPGFRMVGGKMLPNLCKAIVRLERDGEVRTAALEKDARASPRAVGASARFLIRDAGVFRA